MTATSEEKEIHRERKGNGEPKKISNYHEKSQSSVIEITGEVSGIIGVYKRTLNSNVNHLNYREPIWKANL